MTACRSCGRLHDPRLRCEVAARLAMPKPPEAPMIDERHAPAVVVHYQPTVTHSPPSVTHKRNAQDQTVTHSVTHGRTPAERQRAYRLAHPDQVKARNRERMRLARSKPKG